MVSIQDPATRSQHQGSSNQALENCSANLTTALPRGREYRRWDDFAFLQRKFAFRQKADYFVPVKNLCGK